ncbi:MAG: TlpA family protein disulfide reductase [Nitrospirae bacterium]|nr:TlpA family protein disulfide reductase [Nitrospirota bacterium]
MDNNCGVNYFNGWCKEKEKETPADTKKAESDPYIWQPKFANEPPPPLVDLFRDPSAENIGRYQEWYKKRMERVNEVGLIMAGGVAQAQMSNEKSQQGAVSEVKPVIFDKAIYFFSESCPACAKMTPLLSQVQHSSKLVGIGIKSTDSSAAAYLQRNGVRILSGGDNSGDIAANYNVSATPTLILLSESGDVVGRYEGVMDKAALSGIFGN